MRETIAAEAAAATLGRGARREPCLPLRGRGRDGQRRLHAAARRALDRRRRPAAARAAAPAGRAGRTTTSRSTGRSSTALEAGDGERAAQLMRAHVESAVRHWSPRGDGIAATGAAGARASAPGAVRAQSTASATVRTVCACSSPSASSIFCFSSPEAKSSSVMSAPPISSPLTKTCGIVGHSLSARQLLPDARVRAARRRR